MMKNCQFGKYADVFQPHFMKMTKYNMFYGANCK